MSQCRVAITGIPAAEASITQQVHHLLCPHQRHVRLVQEKCVHWLFLVDIYCKEYVQGKNLIGHTFVLCNCLTFCHKLFLVLVFAPPTMCISMFGYFLAACANACTHSQYLSFL
jgi:hypothetical protein